MVNEKYTESHLFESIKSLTGKGDSNLLSKRDVSLIRDLLVDYIINAKDEYIKQIVIQRIITPLKIKGFNEYLFHEYENGKDELYRWYVVNAIINDLDVTPANIERVNQYISERNTSDIGRFLYWIGKNKISVCLPYVEKLLNSPQEPVIATVIETLGLIGNQSTMKLIEPYLRSRNSIIRSMAKKAITNLSNAGCCKEQQSSSKNMSPLITWLDQPAIEKTIKEYEDGFFFEYSIEIDSENLSELWNVLGKAIPFLNELDVNNVQEQLDKQAIESAIVSKIRNATSNKTLIVFFHRVDFDAVRLIFMSHYKALINRIEKESDEF